MKNVGIFIRKWILLTLASVIYSVAIALFLDPNDLAPGGVTGIAILVNRFVPIETGTLILLINIPILLFGLWKFGFRFIVSTIYCTCTTSIFTNLFAKLEPVSKEPLLAGLVGGALTALSLGMIFKVGATSGGTDIIVKYLRKKIPHLRTGLLFMYMDIVIICCSVVVFGDFDKGVYAAISAIVTSFGLDFVLYGRDGAKLLYIISDSAEQITDRILKELDIGVTFVQGYGAYSGKEKRVILCAIRKQMSHKAEAIVREVDSDAFMIVTSANEIYGEGYKSYFTEKL